MANDASDLLHMAGAAAPGKEHHQVDGFGDQRPWRGQGDFQDQLFQAQQRALGGARVEGGDTARRG